MLPVPEEMTPDDEKITVIPEERAKIVWCMFIRNFSDQCTLLEMISEHAGGNLVQLHNTGISAEVEGAEDKGFPRGAECCSCWQKCSK